MMEIVTVDGELRDAEPEPLNGNGTAVWRTADGVLHAATYGEPVLTPKQVAARLGVSLGRVYHWLQTGTLRGIQVPGGGHGHAWRVPESALVGFRPPRVGNPNWYRSEAGEGEGAVLLVAFLALAAIILLLAALGYIHLDFTWYQNGLR
jgi:excisionase family DNA binding protein